MATATVTKNGTRNLKPAPMPGLGGAFIQMSVGTTIKGDIDSVAFEIEKIKGRKGKVVEKERYHFGLVLTEDAELLIGSKKKKTQTLKKFVAGETVMLPEHGLLISAMRRTACEIAGVPFEEEKDTDLNPLKGVYFEITREEDKEITKGEWAGNASAIYSVVYDDSAKKK